MSNYTNRLKELREKQNIMAKDIAALLQISYRNYQRYEKGEIDPPTSKTLLLAEFYNVSIDYLVGRTNKPEINR
ncbi:helix-turn-helix transcriptional regulator [Veillonellaceae bacterium WCA-693-APC-5D-A]|uniref:Helix-turn-helix transcriptional regulator n=1 Tax=Anaerovibrio slackiae TaxID=2652309 RepID=A0A6I2UEH7_9FIRM|nr:helix-turn-helix transcriptional regulator [Anaerovibrio slackiae]MSU09998.1 helix-turn-helix transcriptional regulator [Anaerovibrio slackiae]